MTTSVAAIRIAAARASTRNARTTETVVREGMLMSTKQRGKKNGGAQKTRHERTVARQTEKLLAKFDKELRRTPLRPVSSKIKGFKGMMIYRR